MSTYTRCQRCNMHCLYTDIFEHNFLCGKCQQYERIFGSTLPPIPHYRAVKVAKKPTKNPIQGDWPTIYLLLYILSCSVCLLTAAYYLWFK